MSQLPRKSRVRYFLEALPDDQLKVFSHLSQFSLNLLGSGLTVVDIEDELDRRGYGYYDDVLEEDEDDF